MGAGEFVSRVSISSIYACRWFSIFSVRTMPIVVDSLITWITVGSNLGYRCHIYPDPNGVYKQKNRVITSANKFQTTCWCPAISIDCIPIFSLPPACRCQLFFVVLPMATIIVLIVSAYDYNNCVVSAYVQLATCM